MTRIQILTPFSKQIICKIIKRKYEFQEIQQIKINITKGHIPNWDSDKHKPTNKNNTKEYTR